MLKRLGRLAAKPFTAVTRKTKEKVMAAQLAKLLRYLITAAGGIGVATSDDTLMQIASGLVTVAPYVYSAIKDILAARAKAEPEPAAPQQ